MKKTVSVRKYVCDKFFQYSGKDTEEKLIPIIMEDFANGTNKVTLHEDSEFGNCISVVNKKGYPYLLVHIDRVPLVGTKLNIIVTENTITAQLDNLISVAVAKFLLDGGNCGYNFLFTTREEQSRSHPQIQRYLDSIRANGIPLIDLDIDQISYLSEIPNGEISIRKHDRSVQFDERLVNKLRSTATEHKIPMLTIENNEQHPVYTQMGFLAFNTPYNGAFLGMPLINLHSGTETTNWSVAENAIKLLTVLDWGR